MSMSLEALVLHLFEQNLGTYDICRRAKADAATVGRIIRLELYRRHRARTQQVAR